MIKSSHNRPFPLPTKTYHSAAKNSSSQRDNPANKVANLFKPIHFSLPPSPQLPPTISPNKYNLQPLFLRLALNPYPIVREFERYRARSLSRMGIGSGRPLPSTFSGPLRMPGIPSPTRSLSRGQHQYGALCAVSRRCRRQQQQQLERASMFGTVRMGLPDARQRRRLLGANFARAHFSFGRRRFFWGEWGMREKRSSLCFWVISVDVIDRCWGATGRGLFGKILWLIGWGILCCCCCCGCRAWRIARKVSSFFLRDNLFFASSVYRSS